MTKYCRFCSKDLLISEFHQNNNLSDGLNNKCKVCVKKYQTKNRQRITAKNKEWIDNNRKHFNEIRREYYHNTKDARAEEGKRYYQNSKNTTRKNYIENNSDKIKEYRHEYRLNNKDKDLESRLKRKHNIHNAGTFSMQDWLIVQELHEFKCLYCCVDITNKATIDHFIPLSKGGLNTIENIVPACMSCNQSKHASNPFEWYKNKFGKELIQPSYISLIATNPS